MRDLDERLTTLKDDDIPEIIGSTWLNYKKDVVDTELYKKQMADLTKKLNSLEFDMQNDAQRKNDNISLIQGLVKERLDKDIQNTVIKRLETLELDSRKSKYEFKKIEKLLNT